MWGYSGKRRLAPVSTDQVFVVGSKISGQVRDAVVGRRPGVVQSVQLVAPGDDEHAPVGQGRHLSGTSARTSSTGRRSPTRHRIEDRRRVRADVRIDVASGHEDATVRHRRVVRAEEGSRAAVGNHRERVRHGVPAPARGTSRCLLSYMRSFPFWKHRCVDRDDRQQGRGALHTPTCAGSAPLFATVDHDGRRRRLVARGITGDGHESVRDVTRRRRVPVDA